MAQPGAVPKITPADLKDPTLDRLNRIIGLLYSKISALYGSQPQVDLMAPLITAPAIKATGQGMAPTDLDTLITLRTAIALFGPQTMRTALTTGTSPTGNIQPLDIGGQSVKIDLSTFTGTLVFSGGRLVDHF